MKRALIITYYWPPAGGPGVQRWLQFARYLKEFDIEPVVYVPKNPNYPLTDSNLATQVATDLEVIKLPIREPYRFAKFFSRKKTQQLSSGIINTKKQSLFERLLLFIRGNYFIPDARIGWVNPSVKFLSSYLAENPVDVLITSGPPHSLHLIGMKLKQRLKLRWIADFRDPWTTIHYHTSLKLTKSSQKKHKLLESKVLNDADRVVVTSPSTKKEFELITSKPIDVITNGYVATENIYPVLDSSFSIAHIGSLLSERNPDVLWSVISEIADENSEFKRDLSIKLAGVVGEEILDRLSHYGLKENCELLGYVSHSEAVQLQHNSQVLLLVEIDRPETRAIIPGKIFEYLVAHRPILCLGPEESDIEGIIRETKSGYFFNYRQDQELKATIKQMYSDFKAGSLKSTSIGIEKYSRRELTRSMAAIIHDL